MRSFPTMHFFRGPEGTLRAKKSKKTVPVLRVIPDTLGSRRCDQINIIRNVGSK
jgi:hypothetical protein